jgi:acyl-CoA synthetase (AMP-forming)/AMP-acid ligase II
VSGDEPNELRRITAVDVLREHARQTPERPFLVMRGESRRGFGYGEFDELSERLAAGLLARGLERGERVALCLDNRDADTFYLTLFGCYKAGLVPVPINSRLAPAEVEYIVGDCNARAVVVRADVKEKLAAVDRRVDTWSPADVAARLAPAPADVPAPSVDDLADILYTSGTTGRPKGAVFRHRALAAFGQLMAKTLRLNAADVYQTAAPCYTSTGTHTCPLPILFAGATFVVEDAFDVEVSADRLDEEQATAYFGVPAMFTLLVERLDPQRTFPFVRSILFGGSPMSLPTLARLPERFPNAGLWNLYGLTEGGPNGCVLPPEHAYTHPESVGFPLERTELKIVRDDGTEAEPGEPGEIVLRAETVMEGYLNLPDETADVLVDGWLHTGDVAKKDEEGFVYIVDRKKDMIIRGGFNVYPAEVEAVLLQHANVLEAAVVGVPHPVLGEDIAAAVVLRPGSNTAAADLEALCAERLGDFKRPRHYRLLDELPRSTMGKVLRRELRADLAEQLAKRG